MTGEITGPDQPGRNSVQDMSPGVTGRPSDVSGVPVSLDRQLSPGKPRDPFAQPRRSSPAFDLPRTNDGVADAAVALPPAVAGVISPTERVLPRATADETGKAHPGTPGEPGTPPHGQPPTAEPLPTEQPKHNPRDLFNATRGELVFVAQAASGKYEEQDVTRPQRTDRQAIVDAKGQTALYSATEIADDKKRREDVSYAASSVGDLEPDPHRHSEELETSAALDPSPAPQTATDNIGGFDGGRGGGDKVIPSPENSEPRKRKTREERAIPLAGIIETAIKDGTVYPLGTKLKVEEIAERYKENNPVVIRTALHILEKKGYLKIRRGAGKDRGTTVTSVTELEPAATHTDSSQTLVEQTARTLASAFGEGNAFPPGSKLPPPAVLTQGLGISESTLFEAFRYLKAAGYLKVEMGPNGGHRVPKKLPEKEFEIMRLPKHTRRHREGNTKYRETADTLRNMIGVGKAFPPGEKLPTLRELKDILGVSIITIRLALDELEDEGRLQTRFGGQARGGHYILAEQSSDGTQKSNVIKDTLVEEVADNLMKMIGVGKAFPPGEKLPTLRELAMQLDVSPTTAYFAVKKIKDKNRIVWRPGSKGGYFALPRSREARRVSTLGDPMRKQIAATLRGVIGEGNEFSSGAKLPSETRLARRLGTSSTTVHYALQDLEAEGYLEKRKGKGIRGTYVK